MIRVRPGLYKVFQIVQYSSQKVLPVLEQISSIFSLKINSNGKEIGESPRLYNPTLGGERMKRKEVLKEVLRYTIGKDMCNEDIGRMLVDSILVIDSLGTPYNE